MTNQHLLIHSPVVSLMLQNRGKQLHKLSQVSRFRNRILLSSRQFGA
jgi:hypothetical protein